MSFNIKDIDLTKETLERFSSIKTLSPSSINKWGGEYGDQGLWVLSYLYKLRFTGSPPSVRGQVVEDGFNEILMRKDQGFEKTAEKYTRIFEERANLELAEDFSTGDIEKELKCIEGFIEQSFKSIEELKLSIPKEVVSSTQIRVQHPIGGNIPLDAAGYIDFDFGNYAMDLKTTHRVPSSEVKKDHKKQISFYAKARGERTAKILYISSKKYRMFSLEDREIDASYNDFSRTAENLWHKLETACLRSMIMGTDAYKEMASLSYADLTKRDWDDEKLSFAADNGLFGVEYINKPNKEKTEMELYL